LSVTRPRVLCVDDDLRVLAGLARILGADYEVSTVDNAAEAIALCVASAPFEVIVTDLKMPNMDGIDLLRWFNVNSPDTSGILYSGRADLNSIADALNAGHIFRFLNKPCPPEEVLDAVRAGHERYATQTTTRILLRQATDEDMLTGLPDRRRFAKDVLRLIETEPGSSLAVVVVSIDDIELVRRTLGFEAADGLILQAARRLQSFTRDPKFLMRQHVLFRIDDRLALLWCENAQAHAQEVTGHLIRGMAVDVVVAEHKLSLSSHAGIAMIDAGAVTPDGGKDPLTSLCNAEAACLEAINTSNARIGLFSISANSRERRRLELLRRLRNPEFLEHVALSYQPQWQLQENRLASLEALVRWQDPDLGTITPNEFVPLAEEHADTATRLGDWVLETACRQRQAWRSMMSDMVRMGVNISATQMRTGDLHERVLECLERTGLPPELLEVEITESAAIADFTKSDAQLQALRRLGVNVAIDDFGVGFSSLSYLAQLPANTLKVDRSFIAGLNGDTRNLDLLRGICSLGHAMQMTVVAEGVEALTIIPWLESSGCDVVQGYAIGRPMTSSRFAQWYRCERGEFAQALRASRTGGSLATAMAS
jgi:EAL domain-containing protein (putative c-di-GMP-specific phosphodiesterase class I)/DNA-binding NarL/FixJ family response regulator